jgi:hypothetical protein
MKNMNWIWIKRYCFLLAFQLLLSFASPIVVTWDSYLYLSSAKSIFTSQFGSFYHLIREPIFPIILKILGAQEDLSLAVLFQSTLLVLSVILIWKFCEDQLDLKISHGWIASIVSISVTSGYANAILQQVLFIFMFSLFVTLNQHQHQSSNLGKFLIFSFLGVFSAGVGLSIYLSFLAFMLYEYGSKKNSRNIKLILVYFIAGAVFTAGWSLTKQSVNEDLQVFKDDKYAWQKNFSDTSSKFPGWEKQFSALYAILSIGPERYTTDEVRYIGGESRFFGLPKFAPESPCIVTLPGPELVVKYTQQIKTSTCKSEILQKIRNVYSKALTPLIVFLGFVSLFGFFLLLIFSDKTHLLAGPYLALLLIYALLGAGISRYGAPILSVSPFLGFIIFRKIMELRLFHSNIYRGT